MLWVWQYPPTQVTNRLAFAKALTYRAFVAAKCLQFISSSLTKNHVSSVCVNNTLSLLLFSLKVFFFLRNFIGMVWTDRYSMSTHLCIVLSFQGYQLTLLPLLFAYFVLSTGQTTMSELCYQFILIKQHQSNNQWGIPIKAAELAHFSRYTLGACVYCRSTLYISCSLAAKCGTVFTS